MERTDRVNQQIQERILKGVHTHGEKQAYTVLPIHEATVFPAVLKKHGNELQLPIDLHLSRERQPSPTLRDYAERMLDTLRTTHDLCKTTPTRISTSGNTRARPATIRGSLSNP